MPILTAAVFLSAAVINFYFRYGVPHTASDRPFFFYNFYFSAALCFGGLCGFSLVTGNSVIKRLGFLLVALAGVFCGAYSVNDYYTVNLCFYCAFVSSVILVFQFPKNLYICTISVTGFILFLFHPYIVTPAWGSFFQTPQPEQIVLIALILIFLSGLTASIRFILDKNKNTYETIEHLNQVGTTMLLFNHRLQEYVKNTGEEAVKKDRLRFTSDLHDSCGYVFTNIIAISEAAISWSDPDFQKMRETFKLIQKQAHDGLKRTRETLYMIRELREPESGNIETIFEMKSILEEITDIKINIETGNIQYNYGPDINRILIRIVQEAFTNSVRHGKATCISIGFWELQDSIEMTVRDNGIGAQEIVKGIGLAGMEERVKQAGGSLETFSPLDGGFCLRVSIPLIREKINV